MTVRFWGLEQFRGTFFQRLLASQGTFRQVTLLYFVRGMVLLRGFALMAGLRGRVGLVSVDVGRSLVDGN